MGPEERRLQGQKLKNARKKAGMTVDSVAAALGISVETIRSHEKGARGVRPVVLTEYARLYGIGAEQISGLQMTALPRVEAGEGMPVVGIIQPGAFREGIFDAAGELERLPVQFDPAYAQAVQFALRVEGRSMDLAYPPGSYVICVGLQDTEARVGDHVVVRRQRAGLYEYRLGEVWIDPKDARTRLVPRSTDVAFQAPIDLVPGEVEIAAVVIGSFYRRPRRGPAAAL